MRWQAIIKVLFFINFIWLSSVVLADKVENPSVIADKTQQLNKIIKEIQTLKTNLEKNKLDESNLQKELKKTELVISSLNIQIKNSNDQISQQNSNLKALQTQQIQYHQQLATQNSLFAKQLRAAYFLHEQTPLKLLLSQRDPAQLSQLLHYYRYISTARVKIIRSLNTTLTQLEANQHAIEDHTTQLSTLLTIQQQQRQELEEIQKQRQQVLTKLTLTVNNNGQALQQLLVNKQALENIISHLHQQQQLNSHKADTNGFFIFPSNQQSFSKLQGKLSWPTQGKIIAAYGNAVEILAPAGQKVYAIASGQVVFADWLKGFGLLLIIDQGNGYMSLYGYNQVLYKKTGDKINAGDVIATVGDTGGQTKTGLYFGIRHGRTALNPIVWCK